MRKIQKVLVLLFVFMLSISALSIKTDAASSPVIYIDGKKMNFTKAPYYSNKVLYVDLETVYMKLGYKVTKYKSTVTFTKKGYSNKMTVGKNYIYVNGKKKTIAGKAKSINSKIYLPATAILITSDRTLRWNKNKTILLIEVKSPAIKVNNGIKTISLVKGTSRDINVYSNQTLLKDEDCGWKSSNTKVAVVSTKGVIKAVNKGTTVITISIPGKTSQYQIKLNILPKNVTSISVPKEISLTEGDTWKVPITKTPVDAEGTFLWDTIGYSMEVEVDNSGVITALWPGTQVVTVLLGSNSQVYAEIKVTVKEKVYSLEEVKSSADTAILQKYLNQKYGSLMTPIGDWTPYIQVDKEGVNWLDIDVEWGGYGNPVSPIYLEWSRPEDEIKEFGRVLTDEDRLQTKQILRNFILQVASDSMFVFPSYYMNGGFFKSGYRYPNIRAGYWSIAFLSWNNIDPNYSIDTKVHWDPTYDDYNFVYDYKITNLSFVNPFDGLKYSSSGNRSPVIKLKKGETFQVPLEVEPVQDYREATLKELGISTSGSGLYASIDENGLITANKVGIGLVYFYHSESKSMLMIEVNIIE